MCLFCRQHCSFIHEWHRIRDKNGCTAEELVPPDDPATAQLFREAAVQHFIDVDDVAHGKLYAISAQGLTVTVYTRRRRGF